MRNTKVYVADASSTDGTPDLVRKFKEDGLLDVEVIAGGLPSVGRNAGAARAETDYLLFMDADVELKDPALIRHCVERMKRRRLHCVTTNILCRDGKFVDRFLYAGSNMCQYLSRLHQPFATGMFMMFDRQRFEELGGFNERALYAEDYLLSKKVKRSRFRIVRGGVLTTNRRFRKMGRVKTATLFFKTAFNFWNERHFLRDHEYWKY